MTGRTKLRIQEIGRRTRIRRERRESRILTCLSMISLFLLTGMCALLGRVHTYGVVDVADGYGAVLLREGFSAYVIVGIAAFAVGVAVTAICIRCKRKKEKYVKNVKESEGNI